MSTIEMSNPIGPSSDSSSDGVAVFLWILVVLLFIVFVYCFVRKLATASGDSWSTKEEVYDIGDTELDTLVKSKKKGVHSRVRSVVSSLSSDETDLQKD